MALRYFFAVAALLFSISSFAQSATDRQRWQAQAQNVTIVRDNYGVPHIYGKTDADAVFGLMYTQCEDNFKGIERNYLYQLGRQAEADGEGRLIEDLQMQLIADSADAIREYNNSPLWFKKLMDAFADGINYYISKHPETKLVVFKHYQPWFALMFTDGSVAATNYGDIALAESRRFYDGQPQKVGQVHPVQKAAFNDDPERREIGSNGFAIGPAKSASGHAMLYINPHVPFYFRAEVQMVSNEGLNVYGAVTWGQFFVYQGFNEHCGWMHTSSYADVADVYAEKVLKKDGKWFYQYNDKQLPVTIKNIGLSYLKEGKQQQKVYQGFFTHHGPVLAMRDGKWLALKHYNRSYNALLESWLITKANTFEEYKRAMSLLANTSNNTVYADDKGNTAFWYGNFMPKRNPAFNWNLPVDGSTSATEWQGVHPLQEIVHVYNPSTGWIQNCNATPYTAAGSASPRKQAYPAYMAPDGENYRGITAAKLLSAQGKITLDKLIAKGYNRYLSIFDVMLPPLFKAYEMLPDSAKQRFAEPVQLLREWNKISDTASVATTLAINWAAMLIRKMPPYATAADASYLTKRVDALMTYTAPQNLLAALGEAQASLTAQYGNWRVKWGEINRYQRPADVVFSDDKPSTPVAMVSSAYGQLPSFVSRPVNGSKKVYGYSGNSFIAAVEFGPKLKAKSIITGGSSFDPQSPHYTDQAQGYIDGKFKDVWFYKSDVLKHAERSYQP